MQAGVLSALAFTGLGISLFHAAIPTHWLPFVLAARVQKWRPIKALTVTCLAGTGHVAITAAIGLALTYFGRLLDWPMARWLPQLAGVLLIGFGAYYVVRQIAGHGHVHFDYPHEHFGEGDVSTHRMSDRAAILSLLAFLSLSPCEAFIPIYVSGIRYGWSGFAILTLVLSAGTVAGMIVFTGLTLAGLQRLSLGWLEKYESGVMAALLCAVGVLVLLFGH